MPFPSSISVRYDLRPGDVETLIALHGILYKSEYGWDETFESHVAGPLYKFERSHGRRERIWLLERDETLVGSIAIVKATETAAQLRWLLLHPNLRGQGIGRTLIEEAIAFCRKNNYQTVFLWTEVRLTAAAALYLGFGFKLTEEKTHPLWGTMVTEQRYEMKIG